MFMKNMARKGLASLMILMLITQGCFTGWLGMEPAYAAEDLAGKGISATLPLVNATNVSTSAPLVIEFINPVKKVTNSKETITIRRVQDDSIVAEIAVNSSDVTIVPDNINTDPELGKMVNIKPSESLPNGNLYVMVGGQSFVYADNQRFVGLNKEWTFHTEGIATALLVGRTPVNAASGVSPSANIQLTYNRAVINGAGKMQIYQGNTLFEEIDANSSQISFNADRTTVTIDPARNWSNNSTIYIAVPEGFFRDTQGNDISSIQRSDWGFNVISDPTALTVSSLSPSNGAAGVSLTSELTLTFNKELDTAYTGSAILKNTNGGTVTATTLINSSNNRQLRIIPQTSLMSNTTYSIDIPANVFRDKSGNLFTGLTGASSWSFRTLALDTTAPVLKTAKMYSNTIIRLTYDELLSGLDPFSSSFTVTVNGENRNVSTSYVSGDSVYVVLDTGVAVGQVVRIAYTPGTGTRKIQDLSLNAAAAFSARDVENGLDSIMSKPREGTAYTNTISLYYPETVYVNSSEAYKQFSVSADGAPVGVSSMSTNTSSLVTLNLSRAITNGEVVRVAYQPTEWPIKDSRGQALAGFSGFYVRNSTDTKPPEFQNAEVSGNKLWIYYNEPLNRLNKPLNSQYSVLVDGKAVFVKDLEIEDDLVTLTLASPVTSAQIVTLSYVPGTNRLTDMNGNHAGYLELVPVTYTYGNGTILSGVLQGDTVLINFRNGLKTEASLSPAQFKVQLNGTNFTVNSASASGTVVILKLSGSVPALAAGQTGTVSYTAGGAVALRNALNAEVGTFGPLTLQQSTDSNSTGGSTGVEGRPSWLTEWSAAESGFGQAIFVMSSDTAAVQSATSHNNRSSRQYIIDETKLGQAFDYASSIQKIGQPVLFEVPATEENAYVGIPFHRLSQIAASYRTGTIGIKYKESIWSIPLSQLNLVSMGQSAGITTSPGASVLYVQLESVPKLSSGTLEYMLSRSNAQSLADATDIYITLYNGNTGKNVEQNIKSQYSIKLPGNTSTILTGFTAVDSSTNSLSYVPTAYRSTSTGIVARGLLNGNQTVAPVTHLVNYPDKKYWAYNTINELASKWIISTDLSLYKPNQKITRGEFAEMVAKGLGLQGNLEAAKRFSDVKAKSPTSAYIGAAAEAGIISGVNKTTFKPDSLITREQMAIMIIRAMDYVGQPVYLQTSKKEILSPFKDKKEIKSEDAVAKAIQAGVVQGVSSTEFSPLQKATKVQAAVMLKRMLNRIGYM